MKGGFNRKNIGAALSLAVLWFTNVWREFIFSASYNFYFDYSPALEYTAMIVNVALLTLVFLALMKLSEGTANLHLKRLFQIFLLILGLSAFCGLGSEIMKALSPETAFFVNPLLPTVVLIGCAAFAAKQGFRLDSILFNLKTLALFLLPFALLVCLQLFWLWGKTVAAVNLSPEKETEKNASENQSLKSPKKVIWIIFDGLDYEAMTVKREADTDLSEIDRLMSESFVGENAFSPAFGTQVSLPSLLVGKPLEKTVPVAPNDIILYPADNPNEPFSLRDGDNLVSRLDAANIKTGMVGWTHPYPRIFDREIEAGYWHSLQHVQCFDLLDCSGYLYRMSLQTVPAMTRLFPSLWFNENVNQIERHKYLTAKALDLTARSDFKFLFFHFSIPHGPFIDKHNALTESYFESLEAVSETLRRIRETLETSGQWENTVLIISSDHFGRGKIESLPSAERNREAVAAIDTRIPFIVRFPGAGNRLDYKPAFNTVVTKELILSIFREEAGNPVELAERLDNLATAKPELIDFKPDVMSLFSVVPYKQGQ